MADQTDPLLELQDLRGSIDNIDAALVAGFDLRESLRTRRALVLVLLYLLVASAASGIYVQIVRTMDSATTLAGGKDAAAAAMQD